MFKVNEKFVSIDGEGPTAGALSVFVRFAGCNLRCAWCDTVYAQGMEDFSEQMSAAEIAAYIKSTGINHVTLTGGEPLLQDGMIGLLSRLPDYDIHIETNGSVNIAPFRIGDNIHFILDYKLPASRMEDKMCAVNFTQAGKSDAVKFVAASLSDLQRAVQVIEKYHLDERTQVYFSCVFGSLEPADVVDFMKEKKLQGVKLQLQMHKYVGVK